MMSFSDAKILKLAPSDTLLPNTLHSSTTYKIVKMAGNSMNQPFIEKLIH